MESVHDIISRTATNSNPGQILFPMDFRGSGSQAAIKMALSRLTREGKLTRLAHGIYFVPVTDPVLGKLDPSAEAVAEQLADRERVRIRPTGAFALNKLGLSTQVPTRLVYLTDGHPRKLKIGKATVEFKATTPKKMALKGAISSLLITGLQDLDIAHLDKPAEARIYVLLQQEKPEDLKHDLQLTSGKIYDYLIKFVKQIEHDRLVIFNG